MPEHLTEDTAVDQADDSPQRFAFGEAFGEVESISNVHVPLDNGDHYSIIQYTVAGHVIHQEALGITPKVTAGDVVHVLFEKRFFEGEAEKNLVHFEVVERRLTDVARKAREMQQLRLAAAGHAIRLVTAMGSDPYEKGGDGAALWRQCADDILQYCGVPLEDEPPRSHR